MAYEVKDVFGITDYVVFAVMLGISAAIGIFYAIKDRKKGDTQEFLMGGRSLSVFPVAMSVLASFMSAITLLGTPSEVYRYGTQYVMLNVAFCLVVPSTAYLYLPVFYNLRITSAYEVSISISLFPTNHFIVKLDDLFVAYSCKISF